MFTPSRDEVRQFFCAAWQKKSAGLPLDGAQAVAADLIVEHPEYHALLSKPDAIEQEFTPENGQMNPFLHLSLHLAIAEQLSIDQPPGVRAAYQRLRHNCDVHAAEHVLMECLGEEIWTAQRNQSAMDGQRYLAAIERALLNQSV